MEPIVLVMVPGFLGGLVIALLMARLPRQARQAPADAFRDEPLSTDVINMARIRVAGVGGLGLVAMALAVAWTVPRIGQSLAAGFVLGVVLGAALIFRGRRRGPMPSSGECPGANTTLSIDAPTPDASCPGSRLLTGEESFDLSPGTPHTAPPGGVSGRWRGPRRRA